ncbi:glycosyltransferase [Bradyrhizobium sp. S69]|uniref:glycosyltransferase n=1 Tax=Bradyrhizobium sp. S69 TaxID=1641856 RepID=UPI00131D7EFB|nr:glycosyltransferase [Bradyrhizobium sp. S69]
MKPAKTLSIIVAVYYNAESLPHLHEQLIQLEEMLHSRQIDLELIFVDDGSGDNSLEQLLKIKAARPATKVINLSRNFGAVAASKTGFQFVTGDAFTMLSADLQEPIEQIVLMVDEWVNGHKFVVAARAARGDPPVTKFFASIYYLLLEFMVIKGYPQGGYDLMLMDKVMLPYLQRSTKNTNPNVYAFWLGFNPRVLSYSRLERQHGRSRWTFRKKLKFLFDTVTGFSVMPIRMLSGFGVFVAFLSFLYGISLVVSAVLGDVEVQGFATLAALISFFSGLILVMLGAIGEYLWRVFDAVSSKPEAVIEETFL